MTQLMYVGEKARFFAPFFLLPEINEALSSGPEKEEMKSD